MDNDIVLNESRNLSHAYNSNAELQINADTEISAWLKTYTLPSITRETTEYINNGYIVKQATGRYSFSEFTTSIFIDEEFTTYDELYSWLTESSTPFVAHLLIWNNNRTKIVKRFKFEDFLITDLSGLDYDNLSSEPLSVDVTFSHTRFYPV